MYVFMPTDVYISFLREILFEVGYTEYACLIY